MLIMSQLESGSSSCMIVKQPSSFLCATQRVCIVIIKLDGLLSYTKNDVQTGGLGMPLRSLSQARIAHVA